MKSRYSIVLCTLLGCFAPATGLSGCYVYAAPDPVVAEAEYVPPHVEHYPREYYDGHAVFLIEGRWYFRDRGRWVYYRTEPDELHSRRLHRHRAPPAPERDERRRRAPPARW